MDFLSKLSAQISDLFRSMSPGARIIAGLLLAIVVVSLGFLMTYQSTSPDEYLFGARPLTNEEVSRCTMAFGKAGLGNFDSEGNRIRVPKGQKHLYLAALADSGAMPRAPFEFDQKLSESGNFWVNKVQQQQAIKSATEQEISLVVRHMSGVEKAIVRYKESKENGFPRNIRRVTAAVSVWPQPGFQFADDHVDSIRHLVANWIGTSPDQVEVVDMESGERKSNNSGSAASGSNLYHVAQKELEAHFAAKARKALAYVPDAKVVVNVDLDKIISEKTISQIADPQKSPTVQSTETLETSSTSKRPTSGEPGAAANGANSTATVNRSTESGSDTRKETTITTKALSRKYIESIKAGLVPVHATVAVSIPKSYYRTAWQLENPPPDGQEPEPPTNVEMEQFTENFNNKIKTHVSYVLPYIPDDQSKVKPISVMAFELADTPEPEGPPLTATAALWLSNNWSTLGMMGLGAFSLIMLRGMIRSLPSGGSDGAAGGATSDSPKLGVVRPDDDDEEESSPERMLHRSMGGPNLRDELAEMVRDDPDAAAKVISSWIGNAA